MPYKTCDLAPLILTSAASPRTQLVGKIDDAESISIFFTSSAGVLTSNCKVIVSWWDPYDPLPATVTTSMFYTDLVVGTSVFLTSGTAVITVDNVSFRGIGLATSANALTTSDIVALMTKQILV